jgi:hypothetical protein
VVVNSDLFEVFEVNIFDDKNTLDQTLETSFDEKQHKTAKSISQIIELRQF